MMLLDCCTTAWASHHLHFIENKIETLSGMLESTFIAVVARLSDACLWSGAISCSACLRVLLLLLLRGCQMHVSGLVQSPAVHA